MITKLFLIQSIYPQELLEISNSLNPSIQFIMKISDSNLKFLDILTNKQGKKIWMNSYSKPTDSKNYVQFYQTT